MTKLGDKLGEKLGEKLGDKLGETFGDRLGEKIGDKLGEKLHLTPRPGLEEELPLTSGQESTERTDQQRAVKYSAVFLIFFAISCLPKIAPRWHHVWYPNVEFQQGGWTWLGSNCAWVALALLYALSHPERGLSAPTMCFLCSLFWAYMDAILFSQAIQRKLPFIALFDFVVITWLFVISTRAARDGLELPWDRTRTVRSSTWRRIVRLVVLFSTSLQLMLAFIVSWPVAFILPPLASSGKDAPSLEWNSGLLLFMALAMLWTSFLSRGGHIDARKKAACAWGALVFAGSFVLSSFFWPELGVSGFNPIISIVIFFDVWALAIAASL